MGHQSLDTESATAGWRNELLGEVRHDYIIPGLDYTGCSIPNRTRQRFDITGDGHITVGEPMQVLQNALLLHPSIEEEKQAILSTNPSIGADRYNLLNVGLLFGAQLTIRRPEDVAHGAVEAFQSVGWPLHRVTEGFRLDLKSSDRIDIALLGKDGQCLVAVEIKKVSA